MTAETLTISVPPARHVLGRGRSALVFQATIAGKIVAIKEMIRDRTCAENEEAAVR